MQMVRRNTTTTPRAEKVSTSFKVSATLRKDLKVAAAKEGRDMSDLVEDALRAYLTKHATK
jgi:hypothetical protein